MSVVAAQRPVSDAIEAANHWIVTARPVIEAYLRLDEIEGDLRRQCDERTAGSAYPIAYKAGRALFEVIEGVREEFVCDHSRSGLTEMTDAEWEEVEEFNDELCRSVVSVQHAIKIVGDY